MSLASPRRKSTSLGLVGSGVAWDDACREVLRRQAKRFVVSAVYHAVPARAEQSAKDWQCAAEPSLTRLFERDDIDAVALFDAGWQVPYALELAVRYRKPVLVTGPWGREHSALEPIQLAAREAGVLLMAAFPGRHSPATNRLRELMVTKLGAATRVFLETAWSRELPEDQLIEWIDWCSSVFGRPATEWNVTSRGPDRAMQIELRFPSQGQADLVFQPGETSPGTESLQIDCERGTARILHEREIEWTIAGHGTPETLASERSGTQIVLDQFCRRVVGGLVPVADLGDLLRSVQLAETILAGR